MVYGAHSRFNSVLATFVVAMLPCLIRAEGPPQGIQVAPDTVYLDKVGSEVRATNLPRNAEIVVYCGGPKCPQSRMAAEKLAKLGYENVRAYEGGLEEWKGSGFVVEKA